MYAKTEESSENIAEVDWGGPGQDALMVYGKTTAIEIIWEYLILKELPENQGRYKITLWSVAWWNVHGGTIHLALDLCGVAFPPCDVVNGIIYLAESDYGYAILAFVYIIPASEIVKLTKITNRFSRVITYLGKTFEVTSQRLPNGLFDFGAYNVLFKFMKSKVGFARHHIVPWEISQLKQHAALTKAAEGGWHPSDPFKNGMYAWSKRPDGTAFHANHPNYTKFVTKELDKVKQYGPEYISAYIDDTLVPSLKTLIDDAYYNSTGTMDKYFKNLLNQL